MKNSPPVDDDDDDALLLMLLLLCLKALGVAVRPERKALKLSLVLHKRDEQKGALIVLLINTLLLCAHAFSVVSRSRRRKKALNKN